MKSGLIKKIAVTFEMCGGVDLSDSAKDLLISDLERYPPAAVDIALDRCRAEVRGRMSPSDIIQRIDDGRPGADEAWGLVPKSEAESAVWTDEMAAAYNDAVGLMEQGDKVGSRMTFIDSYRKRCVLARAKGAPVKWTTTLGTDRNGRERVIRGAVHENKLTHDMAARLLPGYDSDTPALPAHDPPQGRLAGDVRIKPSNGVEHLSNLLKDVAGYRDQFPDEE